MKIGVVGLGNIAQKAYLPVMMAMSEEVEWHFYTRDQEKLAKIGKQYRVTNLHPTVESMIDSGVNGVFIHTATHTHAALIQQFLENGIHVYVDKPISENLDEVEALMALAEEKELLLVTGFNRRFAPMIQELKKVSNKNMIFIQKNKPNGSGTVQFGIFDMFIHVIDTAVYLLDEEILEMSHTVTETDGQLENCVVQLETENTVCIASMNYKAGANLELVEVQSPEGTYKVTNLTDYASDSYGEQETRMFGDWDNTLEKRGFAPLIRQYIEAIKTGGKNPVSLESSFLSHQICEEIVSENE